MPALDLSKHDDCMQRLVVLRGQPEGDSTFRDADVTLASAKF